MRKSLDLNECFVIVCTVVKDYQKVNLLIVGCLRILTVERGIFIVATGSKSDVSDNIQLMFQAVLKDADGDEYKAKNMVNMIWEASPLCIEIWEAFDDCMKLIDCNNRIMSVFGVYGKQEYIEDRYRFMPEYQPCGTPSRKKTEQLLSSVLKKGSGKLEYMHITADGEELPLEFTFVRIPHNDKAIIAGYAYDLRQSKVAEKEKIEAIEDSNRAKSKFLAKMSHEIRTPITAVLGISEVELLKSATDSAPKESFAKIHNSANILLNIVNDILDISKIEAGKLEIQTMEYETASMIGDVTHTHLAYLNDSCISFNLNVEENLPQTLIGDVVRIKQIMNNLLSNSFKYTSEGSVTLSIMYDCTGLHISVKDTGFGMTQGQVDDLYSDYTRFHRKETQYTQGVGLGMPIVYNLVKMMDGRIEVKSEVDVGTHMIVCIPQKAVGAKVLGKELARKLECFESGGVWSATHKFDFIPELMPHGKVLVVDDVASNLYVIKAMLEPYCINVEVCESGEAAIDKIKQKNVYDIIFMDHMMPGMDGTETMRILRDLGYKKPIIAFTANILVDELEELINEGFDGFVSKPIDLTLLNDVLTEHIKPIV